MPTPALEETQMNKTAAICKLHEIADHRLLGSGGWPACGEFVSAFFKIISDMGLEEELHDGFGTARSTSLGDEVSINLMTMFAGCWDLFEVPDILERHGYIDSFEADELCELPDHEFEQRLHSLVYRAYLKFSGKSKWIN
jgi:hypothetical protein